MASNKFTATIEDMFREVNSDMSQHLGKALGKDPKKVQAAIEEFWGEYDGPKPVESAKDSKKPAAAKSAAFTKTTLVMNYSDKSCVVFIPSADTKTIEKLKEKFLALKGDAEKKLMSYNARLAFGPGWVVTDPKQVSKVEKIMKKEGVEYDTVERSKVEAAAKASAKDAKPESESKASKTKDSKSKKDSKAAAAEASDSDNDSSSSTVADAKPATKSSKSKKDTDSSVSSKKDVKSATKSKPSKDDASAASKKSSKSKKDADDSSAVSSKKDSKVAPKVAAQNDWKNYELKGFIYAQMKVGPKGKAIGVVIGTQNTKAKKSETGLASVVPLTEAEKKALGDKPYLTPKIVELLKGVDKKEAAKYEAFLASASGDDDDNSSSEAPDAEESDADSNADSDAGASDSS